MVSVIDLKINGLEKEKSELGLSFLQLQKNEIIEKMYKILDDDKECDWVDAISKLNEVKSYRRIIKEIDYKIENNDQLVEDVDNRISKIVSYREKKLEAERNNKQELIAETFWWDEVYQYAKELWDEELIKSLEDRSLPARKYVNILEKDYRKYMSEMYEKLFFNVSINENTNSEKTSKKPQLPKWMIEQMRKELKDNKLLNIDDIESFLRNELKKNWWLIRASHIKNTFSKNYFDALKYITSLIIYYSEFSFVNNLIEKEPEKPKKHKNKKLISTVSGEEVENNRGERLDIEKNLSKLFEIRALENIEDRISKYVDFFIELWYKFSDRKTFEEELKCSIETHAGFRIEKDIRKIFAFLINWNECFEVTWNDYYVFKLNCGRRILWYPNWEIFKICSHTDYDYIINNVKPSKDKRK